MDKYFELSSIYRIGTKYSFSFCAFTCGKKGINIDGHIDIPKGDIVVIDASSHGKQSDSGITIDPKKNYIAFKGSTNICDVEFYQNNLKIFVNLAEGKLDDPFNISRLMKTKTGEKIGHHGNGDYQVIYDNLETLDKLIYLIKQSYKVNA